MRDFVFERGSGRDPLPTFPHRLREAGTTTGCWPSGPTLSGRPAGSMALLDRLRGRIPRTSRSRAARRGAAGSTSGSSRELPPGVALGQQRRAGTLRIQHAAALFLPPAVTGSHVGPRRCHTSGRTLDISFRAWVAAQRHLGLELDPRELTEAGVPRSSPPSSRGTSATADWLHRADLLRLDSPDPAVVGEQHLAEDGSRFVGLSGPGGGRRPDRPAPAAPGGPRSRTRCIACGSSTPATFRGSPAPRRCSAARPSKRRGRGSPAMGRPFRGRSRRPCGYSRGTRQ